MADLDPDSIADSIMRRLGKLRSARTDDEDDDDTPAGRDGGRVPYHRFQAKVAEAKAAKEALAELGAEVERLRAGHAKAVKDAEQAAKDAIKQAQQEAANQVTTLARQHAEDLELGEIGIRDALGRQAARDAYARLPEQGRPPSVVDYLKGISVAAKARQEYLGQPKADPTKAPAAPDVPPTIRAYFADALKDPEPAKPGAKATRVDAGVQTGARPTAVDMRPSKDVGFADFIRQLKAEEGAEG